MTNISRRFHVIDQNSSRRAQIAYDFSQHNLSTQIYENVDEFLAWAPTDGVLFLNDPTGGDAMEKIVRANSSTGAYIPIAMYDESPSTVLIVKAMLAGAIDYLEWPFDASQLQRAIERMESENSDRLRASQRKAEAQEAVARLSGREREVLQGIVEGLGNKQIGNLLGISSRTVEIHRANMLAKLNAASTSAAVRLAIYAGLDEPG